MRIGYFSAALLFAYGSAVSLYTHQTAADQEPAADGTTVMPTMPEGESLNPPAMEASHFDEENEEAIPDGAEDMPEDASPIAEWFDGDEDASHMVEWMHGDEGTDKQSSADDLPADGPASTGECPEGMFMWGGHGVPHCVGAKPADDGATVPDVDMHPECPECFPMHDGADGTPMHDGADGTPMHDGSIPPPPTPADGADDAAVPESQDKQSGTNDPPMPDGSMPPPPKPEDGAVAPPEDSAVEPPTAAIGCEAGERALAGVCVKDDAPGTAPDATVDPPTVDPLADGTPTVCEFGWNNDGVTCNTE